MAFLPPSLPTDTETVQILVTSLLMQQNSFNYLVNGILIAALSPHKVVTSFAFSVHPRALNKIHIQKLQDSAFLLLYTKDIRIQGDLLEVSHSLPGSTQFPPFPGAQATY